MKGLLLDKGWTISHECWCGGKHRIEFVHLDKPGTIIKIYPEAGKWRSSRRGRRIGEGVTESFETFINGMVE